MPIEAAFAIAFSLAAALFALRFASRETAATRLERAELLEERQNMLNNPDLVAQPMAMLRFANLRTTNEIAVWDRTVWALAFAMRLLQRQDRRHDLGHSG